MIDEGVNVRIPQWNSEHAQKPTVLYVLFGGF
jgi:hypothetical protein